MLIKDENGVALVTQIPMWRAEELLSVGSNSTVRMFEVVAKWCYSASHTLLFYSIVIKMQTLFAGCEWDGVKFEANLCP